MQRGSFEGLFIWAYAPLSAVVIGVTPWLGWQSYVVSQRQRLLVTWKNDRSVGMRDAQTIADRRARKGLDNGNRIARVSQFRRLLGDKAIQSFTLREGDSRIPVVRQWFPEAELHHGFRKHIPPVIRPAGIPDPFLEPQDTEVGPRGRARSGRRPGGGG